MIKAPPRHRVPRLVGRVDRLMRRSALVLPGETVLAAVSGGPDSVALLLVLQSLAPRHGFQLAAAHVHHGLRGPEADEDQAFVERLCLERGIPVRTARLDLSDRPRGRSLQAFARERRYAALESVARDLRADKIAVGHTADDQLETVMLWLLRGAGLRGLAGMPLCRRPGIIRPLLESTRAEIVAYLGEMQQDYRVDSSNHRPVYARNRLRHDVLPILRGFAPHAARTVARHREILDEEDRCLDEWTREELGRIVRHDGPNLIVSRAGLLQLPLAIQRRVVKRLLERADGGARGASFNHVIAVLDRVVRGPSGSRLTVPGTTILRAGDVVRFVSERPGCPGPGRQDRSQTPQEIALGAAVPGTVTWPPTGQHLVLAWADRMGDARPEVAFLDADRFTLDLTWRSWRAGDRFCPLGMDGKHKKLQDYFADMKISRQDRHRIPLLVAPEGILWVAGCRVDHRFRVTSATSRVLLARLAAPDREVG